MQDRGMENKNDGRKQIGFGRYYVKMTKYQKRYLAVRGVFERIFAALALIVLSPVFLAVSTVLKISAPNEPVFF